MKNQYLLMAETIFYKNNKLTAINIYDHFVALKLPAEFVFDLAVLCGPGWTPGEHVITINFQADDKEISKLGDITVDIPSENFVYNAIANNLKFTIGPEVKSLSFIVQEGDNVVVSRTYPVSGLMVPVDEEQVQQEEVAVES